MESVNAVLLVRVDLLATDERRDTGECVVEAVDKDVSCVEGTSTAARNCRAVLLS